MTRECLVPGWGWHKDNVPVRREGSPSASWPLEVNQLFDAFFGGGPFDVLPSRGLLEETFGAYAPQVEVTESETDVRVSAELPGLDEKNIEVSLADGVLTIRGEKKAEQEDKGKNYYRRERSYGAFHRAIALPAEVDEAKAEASFKKGVLTITLPKMPEAQQRVKKIDVKGE